MPRVLQPKQAARVLQGEGRGGGGLQPAGLSGQTVGGRGGDGKPPGGSQAEGDRRTARQECRSGAVRLFKMVAQQEETRK